MVNEEALRIFGIARFERLEDLKQIQDGLAEAFAKLRYDSGNILHLKSDGEEMPAMVVEVDRVLKEKEVSMDY